MNTDPRRGLPSATERRRTTVRWSEDAQTHPVQCGSGMPTGGEAPKSESPAERAGKPRRLHT